MISERVGDFIAGFLSLACTAVFILAALVAIFSKNSGGGSGGGIDLPGRGDEADMDDGDCGGE